MKFLKSISLFCFIVLLIVITAFVIVFPKMKRSKNDENREIAYSVTESEETNLAVSVKQNVTTCDTIYQVETYKGTEYKSLTEALPFSFLGLTREELEKKIQQYGISP